MLISLVFLFGPFLTNCDVQYLEKKTSFSILLICREAIRIGETNIYLAQGEQNAYKANLIFRHGWSTGKLSILKTYSFGRKTYL